MSRDSEIAATPSRRNTPEQNQQALNHYNRPCVCGHPWSGHSLLDPGDDRRCLNEDCSCASFRDQDTNAPEPSTDEGRRRKPWQAEPRLDHPFVANGEGCCETCSEAGWRVTRAEHEAERLALALERIGGIADDHPEGEDWRIIREIADETLYADTY